MSRLLSPPCRASSVVIGLGNGGRPAALRRDAVTLTSTATRMLERVRVARSTDADGGPIRAIAPLGRAISGPFPPAEPTASNCDHPGKCLVRREPPPQIQCKNRPELTENREVTGSTPVGATTNPTGRFRDQTLLSSTSDGPLRHVLIGLIVLLSRICGLRAAEVRIRCRKSTDSR